MGHFMMSVMIDGIRTDKSLNRKRQVAKLNSGS